MNIGHYFHDGQQCGHARIQPRLPAWVRACSIGALTVPLPTKSRAMTDFFQQIADQGTPRPETAEVKLDLGHDAPADALSRLSHVLDYCAKSGAASLYVSFAPVKPGEGQSLFQPVAKKIAEAKRKGTVAQAVPMIGAEAAGIFVRMSR